MMNPYSNIGNFLYYARKRLHKLKKYVIIFIMGKTTIPKYEGGD